MLEEHRLVDPLALVEPDVASRAASETRVLTTTEAARATGDVVAVPDPRADTASVRAELIDRARMEHGAAVLDLTDAAQAMALADAAARLGNLAKASAYTARGNRLYASADRRRRLAERLDQRLAR